MDENEDDPSNPSISQQNINDDSIVNDNENYEGNDQSVGNNSTPKDKDTNCNEDGQSDQIHLVEEDDNAIKPAKEDDDPYSSITSTASVHPVLGNQERLISFLSNCINPTSGDQTTPIQRDLYSFTKTLRSHGLDLSDTIYSNKDNNTAWESFCTCLLQNAQVDFISDNLDDLLMQNSNSATIQVEIAIQRGKRKLNNVSCDEIISAVKSSTEEIVSDQISQLLQELHSAYGVHIQPMVFEETEDFLASIDMLKNDENSRKEKLHTFLYIDPTAQEFHTIFLRRLAFESIDDYGSALLSDIVENGDFVRFHKRNLASVVSSDLVNIPEMVQEKLAPLKNVVNIPDLIQVGMVDVEKGEIQTLEMIAEIESLLKPGSISESILTRAKNQYVFGLKRACDLILQEKEAEERDKVRALVNQEEEMMKENDRLQEEEKAAEAEKLKKQQEIKELEEQIKNKEGNKADLEKLVELKNAELKKTAELLEIASGKLEYNEYKKGLMNFTPSYDVLVSSIGISAFQNCGNLRDLIVKINTTYSNNIPGFTNSTKFWKFVNISDSPANRHELTQIVASLLEKSPRFVPHQNDSSILEITGRQIVLSQVISQINQQASRYREIRLVAGKVLYIDNCLSQAQFHGKNIVIASPQVEVKGGQQEINVSGNSSQSNFPATARSEVGLGVFGSMIRLVNRDQYRAALAAGRNGLNGRDGLAGESSGNICIQCDHIKNGGSLKLVANGGNGSFGQNGEDGFAGRNGSDGNNPTFGAPESGDAWRNGKKMEYGTSGSSGQTGGPGGNAGLGGGGGMKGNVSVVAQSSGGVRIENNSGSNGSDGKPGKGARGGLGGVNGVDLLWVWVGWSRRGEWKCYRGKIGHCRRVYSSGQSAAVFFANMGSLGIMGDKFEWDIHMTQSEGQVRGSRASQGNQGRDGLRADQRSRERKTATASQSINTANVSALLESVRNLYGTSSATQQAINISQQEKLNLEQKKTNLNNEKVNALSNIKRLEEEIKSAQDSKAAAEKAKAELEEVLRTNQQNQNDVQASLKQVSKDIAISKEKEDATLDNVQQIGAQIEQLFQKQRAEQRREMEERSKIQKQTNTMREFGEDGKEIITKDGDTSKLEVANISPIESLYDEVRTVKDIHKLSDEFFAIAIAARAKNPQKGEAFELGLQEIKSFTQDNKLPGVVRNFLESRSHLLEKETRESQDSHLSIKYLRNQLPSDVKIALKYQSWLVQNPTIRDTIFRTISYGGQSLCEFLFQLRQHDAFAFKKKIVAVETVLEEVRTKLPPKSKGLPLLNHISSVVFSHMEDWLISQTSSQTADEQASNIKRQTISTFASYVDDFFVELRKIQPGVGLIETYETCLEEIKLLNLENAGTTMQTIWERAALRLTGLMKSGRSIIPSANSKTETAATIVAKEFGKLTDFLSKNRKSNLTEISELIARINFVLDYLVLNVDVIHCLLEDCTQSMIATTGPDMMKTFHQLQQIRGKLYIKYLETIQSPQVSNIYEIIDTTVGNERKKHNLRNYVETFIKNTIESPACTKILPIRVVAYGKIMECLKTYNQSETDLDDLMTQIDNNFCKIDTFIPHELLGSSDLQDIHEKLAAENYVDGLPLFAQLFERYSRLGNLKGCNILVSTLKSCSYKIQQIKNLSYPQLTSMTTIIANFIMKNRELISNNFLLQESVEILQTILSKKWTLHIFKVLKEAEEFYTTKEKEDSKLVKLNLDFIKDYISSSDEIVGATEFLSAVELHLSKVIVNLKENDKDLEISQFLKAYLQALNWKSEQNLEPKEFMIKASTNLNKISRDFVKILIPETPGITKELQNYKKDPWSLSNFSNLLKACCSGGSENLHTLQLLTNAFVHIQEINYKNFHSFNDNAEHEANCTIYAEIFETLATFEDTKVNESSPEGLKKLVSLFKNLVQSVAERSYLTITDYISNKQYTFDMLMRKGLAANLNKILSEFQNLMEIYLSSNNNIPSFIGMAEHFVMKLEKEIVPKLTNQLKTFTNEDQQRKIDGILHSLNFECLLKYFNLLAIPNMPSEVRASVFHLKDPSKTNQLTHVFQTVIESDGNNSLWISPFFLILNKLIRHIPKENISCREIQQIVEQLPSKNSILVKTLIQTSKEILIRKFKSECIAVTKDEDSRRQELLEKFNHILINAELVIRATCGDEESTINGMCQFYSTIEMKEAAIINGDLSVTVAMAGLNWNISTPIPVLIQIRMLNTAVEDIVGKALKKRFGNPNNLQNICMNFEYFQFICYSKIVANKWTRIFGLVVLSIKLNEVESSFFHRLLRKTAPVWEPHSDEENTKMIELIKKRLQETDENTDQSNEFLHIILSSADYLTEEDYCVQMLSSNERNYIRHTFSFTEQKEQSVVAEQINKFLINNPPSKWLFEIETFAVSKVYAKFTQMYFNDCMEILRKVEKTVSVETSRKVADELKQFLNSHVENAQNSEKLAVLAESLTLINDPSNSLLPMKHYIEQFILFKYNFNRSHFLATGRGQKENDSLWFKWMQILVQRCILRKVDIQDFNKLFNLSANLPVQKLVELALSHSLDNWMHAVYLQIVVENFTSFLLIKEKGDLFNIPNQVEEIKGLISILDNNTGAKEAFLIILGEKLLQETQLAQVSRTNIKSSHIKIALTQLSKVPMDQKILKKLENQGILQWSFYIREQLLSTRFPSTVVPLLLKLDKLVGIELCEKFINIFALKETKVNATTRYGILTNYLVKITSNKWVLDENILQKLETAQFTEWEILFENHTSEAKGRFRDAKELIRLMNEDGVNSVLKNLLTPKPGQILSPLEQDVQQVKDHLNKYSTLDASTKNINEWGVLDIVQWAQKIISLSSEERKSRVEFNRNECLAIICQGLYVFTTKHDNNNVAISPGFYPRDTQLMSALLLISAFERRKGCLAEISTGEGKTYITAMMAIYRALAGDDVDVITSSSVLAEENVKEVLGYYTLFGVSATNNCDKIAESDEEKRKERYQCQVIYGDVGSFQRDILLTNFFGKGITMNRTTETVIVDEVDSMLLDKGENILYLSHAIPDLKYLWPLLIEIWQAVHAPDVSQGRVHDVNMIVSFIRERLRSGDFVFPQRLSSFITRRLPVWVKNAFVAKCMHENDPYVLADLDKKGAKVIIVDKDTGVEQTQMHWSNGLHQFLQLKHGDKLSPESLKAVFMSNVGYFQSFRGRLYGITGTLGSTAERELLRHCYTVDFFSMPRFKARNCVEHEAILCQDDKEWLTTVKQEVLNKTGKDEQRAVLIICENISSVEKIVDSLKSSIPSRKISTYTSSFDEEFHKKNKATPLESGDVIVATNLAGRGTDLKTSKSLEGFGGLHVILSFMTPNVRIETQAFGRTARAGLSGSVQFIVQNQNHELDSIDQLRQARDLKEAERLEKFRTRNMQRIEIEEELCTRFNTLYENVKSNITSRGASKEYTNLQLEFLKNQWALWLESSSEKIKILHMVGKNSIFKDFDTFSQNMLSHSHGGLAKYATGAIELTKLGRQYEDKEEYGNAVSCFDQAIHLEPHYAEIAHYYKAACILKQTDSGISAKRTAIQHLKFSENIIRKRIGQMMTASKTLETTDSLRREAGQGTSTNRYEKQVKHESELYQVHIGQIEEAIGHVIDGDFLSGSNGIKGVINKEEGEEILKALKNRYNILKNYRISKKTHVNGDKVYLRTKKGDSIEVEWPSTFVYCKIPVIEFLKQKLYSGGQGRIIEDKDFSHLVHSQSSFWSVLRSIGFLMNENQETVLIVKATKEEIDAVSMPTDTLKDVQSSLGKIILGKNGSVFMPQLIEEPLKLNPDELSLVMQTLKSAGILKEKINFKAEISSQIKASLKWNPVKKHWDGIPSSLEQFRDIIESFIEEVKSDEEHETEVGGQSPKLRSIPISMSDLPLMESREEASRQLWSVLNEFGVIKDCRANFPINFGSDEERIDAKLEEIKDALESCPELKTVFNKYHKAGEAPEIDDVMEVIKASIGRIKTLPAISIEYKELETYFRTGEYPPEIEEFKEMLFADLLECTEKKSWWDWGAFIVAMLGIVQIIAGVLLEVFTAGAATYIASALISEGMGDIAFAIEAGINKNFSWKSYRDHKLISLAITIVTAGVGAWLSRGAQVAKFAGKSGFQLFKAVAMRVIKKSVEAIVFKLADIGIDKLLECIQAEALKNCGSQLKSLFLSDPGVKSQMSNLSGKMELMFQHSYESGQAQKLIQDGLSRVLSEMDKEGIGLKITGYATKVTQGVAGAMGKASGKLVKHGNKVADNLKFGAGSSALGKAAKLAQVGQVIEKLIKGGEILQQLVQLVNLAPDILTRLIRYVEIQTINLKNSGKDKSKTKTSQEIEAFGKFKEEFLSSTQDKIVELFLSKINSGLVSPAFQDLTHSALKKAGKAVEANTKALLRYVRTPKSEEIAILRKLKRKGAMDEKKIGEKIKGKIDLDEIDGDTPIKNSEGKTLSEVRRVYGDSISVYRDGSGKYLVERPSFDQCMKTLGQGSKKPAGFFELMVCANYYKQTIEINDMSGDLPEGGEDGKVRINPHGKENKNSAPALKVAFVKGKDGIGYFAPMVDGEVVYLDKEGKDNNLYQSLGFLKKFENSKDIKVGSDEWDALVKEFNDSSTSRNSASAIAKYAMKSKTAKFMYESGTFEVGTKMWDQSGITSGKRFGLWKSVTSFGDADDNSIPDENPEWVGKSMEILKVGNNFTICETFKESKSIYLPHNLDEAIDQFIETEGTEMLSNTRTDEPKVTRLDSRMLERAVSLYLHDRDHRVNNLITQEDAGYPPALVKARSVRDGTSYQSGNGLNFMEFKVYSSDTLDLKEFKYI